MYLIVTGISIYPVVTVHMREEELVSRHDIALALDAVKPATECLECYIICNPVSGGSYPPLVCTLQPRAGPSPVTPDSGQRAETSRKTTHCTSQYWLGVCHCQVRLQETLHILNIR